MEMTEKLSILYVLNQRGKYRIIKEAVKEGESPEECLLRTAKIRENNPSLSWRARGILTLVREGKFTEYVFLFSAHGSDSMEKEKSANIVSWENAGEVLNKVAGEEEKICFRLLMDDGPFFSLKVILDRRNILQLASLNGKSLTLSPMEYKMLNLFRKNPKQVLTRGQLLEKLWDVDEKFVDEHTLTTTISRIRSKIESDGGTPYIKTIYGMGYQWTGGEAK